MTQPAIGVVGVGSLGRHHARVVRDLDGVRSAGLFDIDEDRSREMAAELGVVRHDSLESLLQDCQGVVVAVPTEAHEVVALEALDRDVHVLIEKPLAPDAASAGRILQRARERGLIVQVGHVERFNPGLRAATPYLDGPLFIESHRMAPFSPRSLDVAVVLDLMIHDVDLVQSLVGDEVTEIAATGVPVITNHIDIANARLGFSGGAVSNLTASRISVERMRKLRVWQPSGYLSLDLAKGRGEFYRPKGGGSVLEGALSEGALPPNGLLGLVERIVIQGDDQEPLAMELASFRDAIEGVAPPPVSGQDGLRALELSLQIEDQIKQHVADTRKTTA